MSLIMRKQKVSSSVREGELQSNSSKTSPDDAEMPSWTQFGSGSQQEAMSDRERRHNAKKKNHFSSTPTPRDNISAFFSCPYRFPLPAADFQNAC